MPTDSLSPNASSSAAERSRYLLHKLGRYEEARAAFEAAAALTGNRRERDLLRRRAAEVADAAR
jgi:predicted RNA polymerase sigma factor